MISNKARLIETSGLKNQFPNTPCNHFPHFNIGTVFFVVLTIALANINSAHADKHGQISWHAIQKVDEPFEDVAGFVRGSIEDKGYKITYQGFVAEMLERTGKAVGQTKKIYKHATYLQFCSATLSREMMAADPANIAFCPFTIFVYELVDDPGKTYVGYRLPPKTNHSTSDAVFIKIENLLKEIIKEALE